jgi:hypothetical protein
MALFKTFFDEISNGKIDNLVIRNHRGIFPKTVYGYRKNFKSYGRKPHPSGLC